jgi:hypothetical protein
VFKIRQERFVYISVSREIHCCKIFIRYFSRFCNWRSPCNDLASPCLLSPKINTSPDSLSILCVIRRQYLLAKHLDEWPRNSLIILTEIHISDRVVYIFPSVAKLRRVTIGLFLSVRLFSVGKQRKTRFPPQLC